MALHDTVPWPDHLMMHEAGFSLGAARCADKRAGDIRSAFESFAAIACHQVDSWVEVLSSKHVGYRRTALGSHVAKMQNSKRIICRVLHTLEQTPYVP